MQPTIARQADRIPNPSIPIRINLSAPHTPEPPHNRQETLLQISNEASQWADTANLPRQEAQHSGRPPAGSLFRSTYLLNSRPGLYAFRDLPQFSRSSGRQTGEPAMVRIAPPARSQDSLAAQIIRESRCANGGSTDV